MSKRWTLIRIPTVCSHQESSIKKGIVDDPITLTVYSVDCPNLTVIDLPGITKIGVGAQKTTDIEKLTTDMSIR